MSASPPQIDGSIVFARWRQCAHIGAVWQIPLNLCFLRPTRVHNPKGKSIGSAVSAQLTAEITILCKGRPFPQNCPFSCESGSPSNSLDESEPTIQTAPRSVLLFSHRWPQSVPILYNGPPLPPQNCPWENLDPNLTHVSLDPPESSTQTASG